MSKSEEDTRQQYRFLKPNRIFPIALVCVLIGATYLLTSSIPEGHEEEKYIEHFDDDYNIYALPLPDKLEFAGEPVPMDEFDIRERFDRELHVNTYWQSQTILFLKRANRWFPVIEPILKQEGVPDDFKYLALIESGFTQTVSPAGATGFWQIMKETGKEYGLEINGEVDERYHVEKATVAACAYLKEAKEKFGSWTAAAGSYNMGMKGYQRQLDRQKADSYYNLVLNSETARYVFRIIAMKQIFSDPEKYGFNVRKHDRYPEIKTQTVTLDTAVADFADWAAQFDLNYKQLKLHNPWLRDNLLTNKEGKSYHIKLPTEAKPGKAKKEK